MSDLEGPTIAEESQKDCVSACCLSTSLQDVGTSRLKTGPF